MKKIYTAIAFLLIGQFVYSQPTVGFQSVATGLTAPVDIVSPSGTDTRMFIAQQDGKVKIWNGTSILATSFLDISTLVTYNGEQGLLSIAFHPNYSSNRYFFVYYNNTAGNVTIARYQTKAAQPNEAEPSSGVVLMSIPKPFTNHNGGKLNFGTDGYLYFATGDGGSGGDPNNYAQTGTSNLGKMFRIDVSNFTTPPYYTVPVTNPYLSDPNINDEIIALGLRNPFRWSFDRQTGDMWIADVGQGLWEEVNFRPASSIMNLNYGWRCFEGTHVYNSSCSAQPNNVFPVFEYGHNNTTGGYSITGGYVYRGTEYSFLQGYYICADFVSRNFWLIKSNGAGGFTTSQSATQTPTGISGFGEGLDGTLYAVGLDNGNIYKVTATAPVPLKLISFTAKKQNNTYKLIWEVAGQFKGDRFIVERSFDNATFMEVGNKTAETDKGKESHSFMVTATNNAVVNYRIKLLNRDGSSFYSPTISLKQGNNTSDTKAFKSGNIIYVSSTDFISQVQVTDAAGRLLLNRSMNATGIHGFDASQFPAGLLLIKVMHENGSTVLKLVN